MDFLEKHNLKLSTILKTAGLVILGVIVIAFTVSIISSSLSSLSNNESITSHSMPQMDYDMAEMEIAQESGVGLSFRNVASSPKSTMPVDGGSPVGDDAEEFEVTQYNAEIESNNIKQTCSQIMELKSKDYVIFENSTEYDKGCNYSFKVKQDNVEEILGIVEELDPKNLQENTYTIKKLVEDFTSEVEILENKLNAIDESLEKALVAYDEVAGIATRVQDVETLSKIIDNKINIIERLTQERINVNSQLDRISRSKAEQLDRLEYTYFSVSVRENKFIDLKSLKDAWKNSIKNFVNNTNQIVQDITINLVYTLLLIIQYVIYLLILVVIVKYAWKLTKYIWKK